MLSTITGQLNSTESSISCAASHLCSRVWCLGMVTLFCKKRGQPSVILWFYALARIFALEAVFASRTEPVRLILWKHFLLKWQFETWWKGICPKGDHRMHFWLSKFQSFFFAQHPCERMATSILRVSVVKVRVRFVFRLSGRFAECLIIGIKRSPNRLLACAQTSAQLCLCRADVCSRLIHGYDSLPFGSIHIMHLS